MSANSGYLDLSEPGRLIDSRLAGPRKRWVKYQLDQGAVRVVAVQRTSAVAVSFRRLGNADPLILQVLIPAVYVINVVNNEANVV